MKLLDLFSGIGGFSLAAHWLGWETVAFVEKDEFCQKVLRKNFGGVPIYDDITTFSGKPFRGRCNIITGGFPCQDISVAGAQKGIEANRSGLWTELCRVIDETRPRFALVENVTNLIAGNNGKWFARVLGDLDEIGFDAEWSCIPASKVGAPHIRDRVWILAYPAGERRNFLLHQATTSIHLQCVPSFQQSGYRWRRETSGHSLERVGWSVEPEICGSDDDVPNRVDRLRALGNAIVPQIAFEIFRAIEAAETEIDKSFVL